MIDLTEGIFENDLQGLILPVIDIYSYEPKIEPDAIVIAFYAKHVNAAEDLSIFIEKSAIEEVLDAEVSSAPDEDGYYLVFIELDKSITTKTIMQIIDLCEHLCDIKNWKFTGYKLSKEYDLTAKNIATYLTAIKTGKLASK